jgi:hypothetical protein
MASGCDGAVFRLTAVFLIMRFLRSDAGYEELYQNG